MIAVLPLVSRLQGYAMMIGKAIATLQREFNVHEPHDPACLLTLGGVDDSPNIGWLCLARQ
jgi:hypothetical protein